MRDFAFRPAGWYFKTYTYINTSINRACLWLLSARATAASFSNFFVKSFSRNFSWNWFHEKKKLEICTNLKINTRQGSTYLVYILIGPAKNLKKNLEQIFICYTVQTSFLHISCCGVIIWLVIWGCVHFFKCFFTFHFISKTQNLYVCIVSTFFFICTLVLLYW